MNLKVPIYMYVHVQLQGTVYLVVTGGEACR